MMKRLLGLCLILFSSSELEAQELSSPIQTAFEQIERYNRRHNLQIVPEFPGETKFEINDNAVIFTNTMPLKVPVESAVKPEASEQIFSVSTIFLRNSPTIEKRVHIKNGPEAFARMRFIFKRADLKQTLLQHTYKDESQAWQIYESPTDIFFYTQAATPEGEVDVKEWIYAQEPNDTQGSVYNWQVMTEEFKTFLELQSQADGSVVLQRYLKAGGVDAKDREEHKRISRQVHTAMKETDIYIHGEDKVGTILPVVYWTKDGVRKKAKIHVVEGKRLSITINESKSAYPLIVDPVIRVGE